MKVFPGNSVKLWNFLLCHLRYKILVPDNSLVHMCVCISKLMFCLLVFSCQRISNTMTCHNQLMGPSKLLVVPVK